MALFKCKMCGGALEIKNKERVAVCEYCGTQQTIPILDDDRRASLYDRANHFRRNNEFDKAMGIYEQILNEDGTDAEAYWSLVLCRYGIEYVEDPSSHKRVPTVNRAQFTAVFDDDNYKSALKYADGSQKSIYEEEAKDINEIQKGILSISQQEEPFDVFICYKETDNFGRRTPDSVLANELYHELTEEGFKVFFSRITLEDKIGSAYEPYIFAALNSAKVMVALGTKPEYFQAPWVKNEWGRYLALIRNGAKKTLIPAYKDMDPYDLPEEFSHLQAQDMSKLGFMQDIIRGIGKIAEVDEPRKTVSSETITASVGASKESLLKRVFIFLEDGDWVNAIIYCEKVLDMDPETGEAYLGKLMAELQVRKQQELADCKQPFTDSNSYQKVMRFGNDALKNTVQGYIEHINTRNENARLESIYNDAVAMMDAAESSWDYQDAASKFLTIEEYKDSSIMREKCLNEAEISRKDAIYHEAEALINDTINIKTSHYKAAIYKFQEIPGWRDADEQLEMCKREFQELQREEERKRIEKERLARRKKRRKRWDCIVIASVICSVSAGIVFYKKVFLPERKYAEAAAWIDEGKYEEAYDRLLALEGYKDSREKAEELKTETIPGKKYEEAVAWISEGKYEEAYEQLLALEGYRDSKEQADSIYFEYQIAKGKKANVGDYIIFGAYELDENKENGKEEIEWLVLAKEGNRSLVISRYALDYRAYHNKYEEVTWKSCSLRKWLNKGFMEKAFSKKERAMIPAVEVKLEEIDPYAESLVSFGKTIKDRVFLLGVTEAEEYFATDEERMCMRYPITNSINCQWPLRSTYDEYVAIVGSFGDINASIDDTVTSEYDIRPAMWIDWGSEK